MIDGKARTVTCQADEMKLAKATGLPIDLQELTAQGVGGVDRESDLVDSRAKSWYQALRLAERRHVLVAIGPIAERNPIGPPRPPLTIVNSARWVSGCHGMRKELV